MDYIPKDLTVKSIFWLKLKKNIPLYVIYSIQNKEIICKQSYKKSTRF